MSLFNITSKDTFIGPHQPENIKYAGSDLDEAQSVMIMIHGRGASAESILELRQEFQPTHTMCFMAPQATGHTWYPFSFLAPTEKNQPGLNSGLQAVYTCFDKAITAGIKPEQIIFLGFSQGACLASEFVVRHPNKYGGLIALSGGLIGNEVLKEDYEGSLDGTPVFQGCSNVDPHIPEERVHESAEVFKKLNAEVTTNIYPGMGHTVNRDEIEHINTFIRDIE